MQPRKKKLLDQVRDKIRLNYYSLKTERSCVDWIKRYIVFHNKRYPLTMGLSGKLGNYRFRPCREFCYNTYKSKYKGM